MNRTDPFTEILDRDPELRAIADTDAAFDGKPGEDPCDSVTALLEDGEPGVYTAGAGSPTWATRPSSSTATSPPPNGPGPASRVPP